MTACIFLVHEPGKPWSRQQLSCTNTWKELRTCVRRLGTIIKCIFCSQSGAGIRLNFWKWSYESRYPGALPPLLENLRPTFSPDPTDCPWVSEDRLYKLPMKNSCTGSLCPSCLSQLYFFFGQLSQFIKYSRKSVLQLFDRASLFYIDDARDLCRVQSLSGYNNTWSLSPVRARIKEKKMFLAHCPLSHKLVLF